MQHIYSQKLTLEKIFHLCGFQNISQVKIMLRAREGKDSI